MDLVFSLTIFGCMLYLTYTYVYKFSGMFSCAWVCSPKFVSALVAFLNGSRRGPRGVTNAVFERFNVRSYGLSVDNAVDYTCTVYIHPITWLPILPTGSQYSPK